MNIFKKIGAVVGGAMVALVATAAVASAQTAPTFDPGAEATGLFNTNWPVLLDTVKDMAPLIIGAGLVLAIIGRLVGSFSRGKAPRRVVG